MSNLEAWIEHMKQNIEIVDTPEPSAPTCPDCDGTGYIHYDVPFDDPRFGKMFKCPNPSCAVWAIHKHEQAEKVMSVRSSWEEGFNEMTFRSFWKLMGNANSPNWRGKRGAYAMALAFSQLNEPFDQNDASQNAFKSNWPDAQPGKSRSVVLTGDVGTGKTGLARAACNELRAQNKVVIYIRLQSLIRHIQETYHKDWQGETSDTRMDVFIRVPYLIIDEFEVQNYSDDRLESIERIIRERADKPAALPFMLTTNLTQKNLTDLWGKRIADVVSKAHIVPMTGLKMRQTMQTANGDW